MRKNIIQFECVEGLVIRMTPIQEQKEHIDDCGAYRLNTDVVDALASEIVDTSEKNPGSDPLDILLAAIGRKFSCSRMFICERR